MATNEVPFMDLSRMLEQFKLPGVDVNALVEARRKDVEALMQANQKAYQGVQALAQRQAELLTAAASSMQSGMASMAGKPPAEVANQQAEMARQAFDKALVDMRELAEIMARSQAQAYETLSKRFQEHIQEFQRSFMPK